MRLKTITTGLLIFGIALLFGLPILMGRQPASDAPRTEKAQYAVLFGSYTLVIFAVAIAVIICAMVVLRRTANELRAQSKLNMEMFVEGSLRDHAAKKANAASLNGQPAFPDDDLDLDEALEEAPADPESKSS
jgi:hypothetical protein